MKVIHLIRPIQGLVPEVEKPTSTIPFREKVLWTSCALLVYMVLSNLPLFGVQRASSSDPFYWMRVILASNRGTLMELGVSPLVTTGKFVFYHFLLHIIQLITYSWHKKVW